MPKDGSKTKRRAGAGLIAAVLVACVAAGGLALYVKGGLSGNTSQAAAAAGASHCAAKTDFAKKVGVHATGGVAAMLAADPPVSLAALTFDSPEGKPMTVGDLAGKTLVFNLWATWCPPCRAEMPALDALQEKLGSDKFEVVAVNVDSGDKAKPEKFLNDTGVTHLAHYRENTLALFTDLKKRGLALGLPVTLVIDAEGCLITHMNGPAEWNGEDAHKLVQAVLDEQG